MARVLLTNAQLRKTLAAVRSLGRRGIETVVLEETRFSPAAYSRYCTKSLVCPSPRRSPEEFYNYIYRVIQEYNCDVFFPMDEDTVEIAMNHKEELSKICALPIPPAGSYNITSHKGRAYQHAIDAGIDLPRTVFPAGPENLHELTADLTYPLIVKPVKSAGGRGIKTVQSKSEMEQAYLEVHGAYPYPVIQEHLGPGDVYDVVLLYNPKSQLRASFIQRHVRKYPLDFGPSSVQESVYYPEMLQMSLDYMKGLEWQGIADLEFMVEKKTGRIRFLELNAKFWNSLQMGIFAGVDFPWLLYKIATEGDVEGVFEYRTGLFCRNLLPSDILHLIFNPDRKNMNPPFWGGKKHNMYDDIIWREDPLSTLGFGLACLRYMFDRDMWKFLLRRH